MLDDFTPDTVVIGSVEGYFSNLSHFVTDGPEQSCDPEVLAHGEGRLPSPANPIEPTMAREGWGSAPGFLPALTTVDLGWFFSHLVSDGPEQSCDPEALLPPSSMTDSRSANEQNLKAAHHVGTTTFASPLATSRDSCPGEVAEPESPSPYPHLVGEEHSVSIHGLQHKHGDEHNFSLPYPCAPQDLSLSRSTRGARSCPGYSHIEALTPTPCRKDPVTSGGGNSPHYFLLNLAVCTPYALILGIGGSMVGGSGCSPPGPASAYSGHSAIQIDAEGLEPPLAAVECHLALDRGSLGPRLEGPRNPGRFRGNPTRLAAFGCQSSGVSSALPEDREAVCGHCRMPTAKQKQKRVSISVSEKLYIEYISILLKQHVQYINNSEVQDMFDMVELNIDDIQHSNKTILTHLCLNTDKPYFKLGFQNSILYHKFRVLLDSLNISQCHPSQKT